MRTPSGLKAALRAAFAMHVRLDDLLGRPDVPHAGGPSPEAVTMRAPSGLNAAKVRNCSCRYTPGSGAPVVAFHMRAVLSWEAVTMLAPSGLNAAEVT